ncbi:MAG: DUF1638 domain-containing protein [Dehalobacterium sp.]|jgi:hypothetical protein
MKAVICACRTIEDELNFVLEENKIDYPVIYIEAGLHSEPEKLKRFLQDTINMIENVDYILLGYALCGNGLIGLSSPKATLVLPQYHDCVAMFLGSDERYRANLGSEMAALFVTGGSMRYFNPKEKFYYDIILRLGEKKALRYSKCIFQNYKRFALVETGAFNSESIFQEMKEQAEFFDLDTYRMQGTVDVFRKLVLGQWDEHFQIVPPGKEIEAWDLSSDLGNNILPGL